MTNCRDRSVKSIPLPKSIHDRLTKSLGSRKLSSRLTDCEHDYVEDFIVPYRRRIDHKNFTEIIDPQNDDNYSPRQGLYQT
jgi:hypothetical protein